ncbi:MAG: hypothetical protein IJR34_06825 [Bacteroidales bacterium]|nr:hypothetical protein [Bacteroidales bacterium]
MTRIDIYGTDKWAEIPSSWDEMTPAQIRFVFKTYDECLRKGASPLDFNIRVLYHLLGIRRRTPAWKIAPESPLCENIYMLCERCLGFLFTDSGAGSADGATAGSSTRRLTLSCKRLDNPLPTLRVSPFRVLHGPGTLCQDLTFGEFRQASAALNQFFKTSDVSELDDCIRHLYRPWSFRTNRAGRCVRPIGSDGSLREIKAIARVPMWQKNLILVWFSSCLDYLQKEKVIVDGDEIDMHLLFSGEGKSGKTEAFTWTDLLVQIAREGTIGTMAEVDREPLFSIFSIMWSNYKENKRYEKASKTK